MTSKKTYIVNLFGGPGVGKSTLAYRLTGLLKASNINSELATEFAKDLVWSKRHAELSLQPYVFGEQYRRIKTLVGQVEVVVTDSPLLLSVVYSNDPDSFKSCVKDIFVSFDNINFFISRSHPYDPTGRGQTEEEADKISNNVKQLLHDIKEPYFDIEGKDVDKQIEEIVREIENFVKEK